MAPSGDRSRGDFRGEGLSGKPGGTKAPRVPIPAKDAASKPGPHQGRARGTVALPLAPGAQHRPWVPQTASAKACQVPCHDTASIVSCAPVAPVSASVFHAPSLIHC